jgi:RimJ/RimL family protein N-acetyltransferase
MIKKMISDRLILRPWQLPTDKEAFFQIYRNTEVTHFLPRIRQLATDVESLNAHFLVRLQDIRQQGNGSDWWAMIDRTNDQIIGSIILQNLPDKYGYPTPEIEVGWHLRRDYWGKGYMTEAAKVILEYGFLSLQLPIIYAVVNPDNYRSIRVTERLRMQSMGLTDKYYGTEALLFSLTSNDYNDV